MELHYSLGCWTALWRIVFFMSWLKGSSFLYRNSWRKLAKKYSLGMDCKFFMRRLTSLTNLLESSICLLKIRVKLESPLIKKKSKKLITQSNSFKIKSIFSNNKSMISTLKCSFSSKKCTILMNKSKVLFILLLILLKIPKLVQTRCLKNCRFLHKVFSRWRGIRLGRVPNLICQWTLKNPLLGLISQRLRNS